jgi:hypothetical protein
MKISHKPDTLCSELTHILRHLRVPSRCSRDLRSSEMLHCVCWFVTDVSGHRIGHVLRGQDDHKDCFFLGQLDNWNATNNLSRNFGNKLTNFASGVSVSSSGVKMSKKKNPFIYLDKWRGDRHAVPKHGKPVYFIQNPRRAKSFITFSGVLRRLNMTLK